MKNRPDITLTKRPLTYWILNRFRLYQLILLFIILVSLFFRIFPLEMQRKIINEAINLKDLQLLYLYCGLYLGAVLLASILKYFTNSFQAIIGQKLLIEIRQELYNHILQLPLQFFHQTQAGTIISAMTAELNAIGKFLGGSLAIPITSLLTFVAFAGYMISLNPLLGFISIIVYPFELILIPLLQRRYNTINQTRVTTTRAMANLINEAASGIQDVQGNAGFSLERSKLDQYIHQLYKVMKRLTILKYGIKFSNNLFQSVGPFILFLVGGYMAIHGNFTIGALVAFLSAYEKVYDPWKEVIEYYQGYQDAKVRYKQIMKTFDLEPVYLLEGPQQTPITLQGHICATKLNYVLNGGIQLLDDINFSIPAGKHLALVGYSGSGKSTLSLLLGQLYQYSSGTLTVDGHEVKDLGKLDVSRNISTVSQHPFIFTGTVKDNLQYGCKAMQLAGVIDTMPPTKAMIDMVEEVGLSEDVLRWGLRSVIPPDKATRLIGKFLLMRTIIQNELHEEFSKAVEFYDPEKFLEYSTIATNLTFSSYPGTPLVDKLMTNTLFNTFLKNSSLELELILLGRIIAETTIKLLADFKDDAFFFQGSPMDPNELDVFITLIKKTDKKAPEDLLLKDKNTFLALALRFIPEQHKIFTMSQEMKDLILLGRQKFLMEMLHLDLEQCKNGMIQQQLHTMSQNQVKKSALQFFTPFCESQYLYSHSLLNNILFGTVTDTEKVSSTYGPLAMRQFKEHGLLDEIFNIGLDFHVGSKGDHLSGGQKQKIALARALLKNAPLLILDEATASLDNSSQAKIQNYIRSQLKGNTTVVSVIHRLDMAKEYDHILVMKAGKILESGNYSELMKRQGALYELTNNA